VTQLRWAEQYRFAGVGFSVEPNVIGLPRNDSDSRARRRFSDRIVEQWFVVAHF